MARRLSDQQYRRIQARQTQLREQHALPVAGAADKARAGLVIAAFGTTLVVEANDNTLWQCSLRRAAGRALCGDRVLWQAGVDGQGVVLSVLTRRNQLAHRDGTRPKLIAANVDRLIVVLSAQLAFNALNLDRVLTGAALQDIDALIVINKIDLLNDAQQDEWDAHLAPYRALGYPVVRTSARQCAGVDALAAALAAHSGVLIGASGVGKSSLVRCLLPSRDIRVGAVSALSGRGRHTTSVATLYHLPTGGDLTDAPGLSDFGPSPVTPERLAQAFTEFRPYLGTCKFRDCSHRNEPGCALLDAVQRGAIAAQRLASLHALIAAQNEAK